MAPLAFIIATVLFAVAWLTGGVHATAADFIALGLTVFALGHVLPLVATWLPQPPARQ